MNDQERLAVENKKLREALSKAGFSVSYKQNQIVIKKRKPKKPRKTNLDISVPKTAKSSVSIKTPSVKRPNVTEKHTAKTWAKRRGFKTNPTYARRASADKAISLQRFKNLIERTELIQDARMYLYENDYKIPAKFFDRVPTYVLKNNDFYENVNKILNSKAESEGKDIDISDMQKAIEASIKRIRRVNNKLKS